MGSAASGVQKPTPHSAPSSAPPKPIALPSLIPFASCSHPHKRRGWLSQTRGEQLQSRMECITSLRKDTVPFITTSQVPKVPLEKGRNSPAHVQPPWLPYPSPRKSTTLS